MPVLCNWGVASPHSGMRYSSLLTKKLLASWSLLSCGRTYLKEDSTPSSLLVSVRVSFSPVSKCGIHIKLFCRLEPSSLQTLESLITLYSPGTLSTLRWGGSPPALPLFCLIILICQTGFLQHSQLACYCSDSFQCLLVSPSLS